ncbi:hypothetical protein B0H14DRAFT_2625807 [Mycena olivaceomarginata]|nr:hypothetical protein B0H14DRAFT_2625807 [Mycena olivaceomarginata]
MGITQPQKCCADEAPIDELLDPLIEQEDTDSEFSSILEYLRNKANEGEDDEEELLEPEFNFNKKDAMEAVNLLQKVVQHWPDLEVALLLGSYLDKFCAAMVQETEETKV